MINTNPWIVLQQVKDQYRKTEDNFSAFLVSVANNESLFDKALQGATGYTYTFNVVGSKIQMITNMMDENTGQWSQISSSLWNSWDEFMEDDTTAGQALLDMAKGEAANKLVADLCNQFQLSPNLSLADIDAVINASGVDIDDKTSWFNFIKTIVRDGKASNYGFLSIIQKILQHGDNAASSGTTIMDKSSPFAIQSTLATVFSIISSVLSTLATALHAAIGAILFVLGQLLSTIFQSISKYVNNAVTIDLSSSTYYVKGPAKYCEQYSNSLLNSQTQANIPILYQPWGPYDVFSWPNDANNTRHDVNAFITVGFDVEKALRIITGKEPGYPAIITASKSGDQYKATLHIGGGYDETDFIQLKQSLYTDENMYLNQAQCLSILADPKLTSRYLYLCLWFDNLLNVERNGAYPSDYDFSSSIYVYGATLRDGALPMLTMPDWNDMNSTAKAWSELAFICLDPDSYQLAFYPNTSNVTGIQNWYTSYGTPNAQHPLYGSSNYPYPEAKQNVYKSGTGSTAGTIDRYSDPLCGYIVGYAYDYLSWGFPVDDIPTSRCITVPDVTLNEVVEFLTILSVAISALVIARTVVGKIVQRRSNLKRLNAANALSGLRDAYEINPSTENYKALRKATFKYNLKAKLFGWQTYDPVNNWFNDPDVSMMAAITSSDALPSAFSSLAHSEVLTEAVKTTTDTTKLTVDSISQNGATKDQIDELATKAQMNALTKQVTG